MDRADVNVKAMSMPVSAPMSANNNSAAATTHAGASAANTAAQDPISGQPIAMQQLQDRAITILENNQLLMRYAVANALVCPFW